MKKWLGALFIVLAAVLSACGTEGGNGAGQKSETALKIGASNIPHAIILEKAKPILKKQGIDLEIIKYQDYIIPNQALESDDLDANYFQHIPYLEGQIKDHGYDFVSAGGVHIEPIGVYSQKYKSLEELPEGAEILLSSSVADHGRILMMLEEKGLIKLKDGVDKTNAHIEDIAENSKKLKFEYEYEASFLPTVYKNGEGDAVLINSNYAIDVGLNPLKDSIALEEKEASPYVNVVAVKKGNENNKAVKKLMEVLHSKEIQDFILKEWKGSVVPVSN